MKQIKSLKNNKKIIDCTVPCAVSAREKSFLNGISSGNTEMVKMLALTLDESEYSEMGEGCSAEKLQGMRYRFAIAASMIARHCAANGMAMADAFKIGSEGISKADQSDNADEITNIFGEMNAEFARNMRRVNSSTTYSQQITRAVDYISDNLHGRIRINEAAAFLSLSPSYLSRLFKAETGVAFSDYVNRKKAEEAADLLRWSEFTDLEISNLLRFSSQSYFIKVFRRYIGSTPKEYRKSHIAQEYKI